MGEILTDFSLKFNGSVKLEARAERLTSEAGATPVCDPRPREGRRLSCAPVAHKSPWLLLSCMLWASCHEYGGFIPLPKLHPKIQYP